MEWNDLICCGNCIHRTAHDERNYYEELCEKEYHKSSAGLCEYWEWDGYTQNKRLE